MTATPAARHQSVMDPTALFLAGVYAEALLGAADEAALDPGAVGQELVAVADLLSEGEGVLLLDPEILHRDARVRCVDAIFHGRVSDVVAGLLSVMARRGRLGLVKPVAWRYGKLVDRRQHRLGVDVASAVPLDPAQKQRIEAQLRQVLRAEPILTFRVDRRLIGGLRVRVGDDVYDASVGVGIERLCRHFRRSARNEPEQGQRG
jgi:F-type H+-transporting ATPase subunit delta